RRPAATGPTGRVTGYRARWWSRRTTRSCSSMPMRCWRCEAVAVLARGLGDRVGRQGALGPGAAAGGDDVRGDDRDGGAHGGGRGTAAGAAGLRRLPGAGGGRRPRGRPDLGD